MTLSFPQLIFGLIGAIGTDLNQIQDELMASLRTVGYIPVPIKLSDLMRELNSPWSDIPARENPDYYERAMNAGNKLREDLGDCAAMANLAIASIRRRRDKAGREVPPRVAYILNSLKREEEIAQLRKVYGAAVFIISAYSPRESRVTRLAKRLAEQQHDNQSVTHRPKAEELILRDENEKGEFGQGVRKAYPLADLFLNTGSKAELGQAIERFIELLFGNFWKTPTKDEEGMALAHLASVRSASPARQVGAAITDELGRVHAIGVNEVPRTGGGQYWEGDLQDGRDFLYNDCDQSDAMRWNLLSDVLDRLRKLERLAKDCPTNSDLFGVDSKDYKELREARIFDTIDFIRSVHAEAAALFAAGSSARGSNLYVTTFPCHECARHIAMAGIKRVVYIEPYPKSLVSDLFQDSIAIDAAEGTDSRIPFVPFSGIAPSIYGQLFRVPADRKRKEKNGKIIKWEPDNSFPHLSGSYSEEAARVTEESELQTFTEKLKSKGIWNDKD